MSPSKDLPLKFNCSDLKPQSGGKWHFSGNGKRTTSTKVSKRNGESTTTAITRTRRKLKKKRNNRARKSKRNRGRKDIIRDNEENGKKSTIEREN